MRVIIPSFSIERRLSVKTFWLIPSKFFFSSLNRHGRASRFRMISSFHLLPIIWTVVATGQADISSKEEYTMPFFTKITSTQLDRLRQALAEADALVIGAGAGLSASAGLTYDGPRFRRYFGDFQKNTASGICTPAGFIPSRP